MEKVKIKSLASIPSNMPRSGIRVLMEMASKLNDVIHLEVGEPSFPTPRHIIKSAFEAARQGYTKYTSNSGFLSLREAISGKMKRVNSVDVPPDCITVTVGGIGGLSTSMLSLVNPGDEVLVPDPGWPNYFSLVTISGAKVVRYPLFSANRFIPDVKDIRERISEKTKVLLLNSPSNPCGAVFPREVVHSLINLAEKYGFYILSDEVYDEIVFDGKHVSFASIEEGSHIISVFSFSKTYSMTGWRIGYTVAPSYVSSLISKLQEPFVSCASAISQKAAEAALLGPQESVVEQRKVYKSRCDRAVQMLSDAGLLINIPQGAFYIMADISSTGMDSNTFAKKFLEESHVAVAPGETFGDNTAHCVRISLATKDDELIEGVGRLCEFCSRNKVKT